MRYVKAFTYFAGKPNTGWKNVLAGALCLLAAGFIPIVPWMVWLGYRSYAAADLEEDPDLEYHRDFDLDKFGDYLGRGVWQFLIQLVVTGTAAMIALAGAGVGVVVVSQSDPNLIPVVILAGYLLMFVMTGLAMVLMWPLELYAALTGQFSVGRAVAFAVRFARLMWGESLASIVVYFLLTMVANLAGFLLCCLGMLPAGAIASMAEIHLILQLYRRYLDKGGEPVRNLEIGHDLADED